MKWMGPTPGELRDVAAVVRGSLDVGDVGHVLVTGMLAEQLARQLSDGAAPGAVVASDRARLAGAEVLVHVIAGELSDADDQLLRDAERREAPVVVVQIWPQEDWTPPFVRTPFVVECKAGAGFPIPAIAGRIVEAVEEPVALAARVPALRAAAAGYAVTTAMARTALLAVVFARSRAARPLITLEQVGLLASLRGLKGGPPEPDALRMVGGAAAAVLGGGFAFREAARAARSVLPRPVADAAVAAGATWLVGEAARRMGSGLSRST